MIIMKCHAFFCPEKWQKSSKWFLTMFRPPTPPQIFSSSESKFSPLSFELFKIDLSRCENAKNRILPTSGISKFRENHEKKKIFFENCHKIPDFFQTFFFNIPIFKICFGIPKWVSKIFLALKMFRFPNFF